MGPTRAPYPTKATHSGHIERWLGVEQTESLSRSMKSWYGPPIALAGVPGAVYAVGGGDFIGKIHSGSEISAIDRMDQILKRERRNRYSKLGLISNQLGAFGSVSAVVTAITAGKGQFPIFSKTGLVSNAIGNSNSLWARAGQPAAGAVSPAAPTGTSPTSATVGALKWTNPTNANLGHFLNASVTASVSGSTLLLYDRLFSVAKLINSTATEAVSGTYTRYQNTIATASDYIGGTFCFPAVTTTALAAVAHNWTVCQYTNQANVAANSIPSIAGVPSCGISGIDLPTGSWFMPLSAGDVGLKALTQMQCSALVTTGTIDFVIGHPIAFCPCPVANMVSIIDGLYSAINLTSIFDNACLAFLEITKPATTATSYSGQFTLVGE